jgi:hypothetical protein
VQCWTAVLDSLLSSSEFLSSIIGASVGGSCALIAQWLAIKAQRKRDLEEERRSVTAVVRAFGAELTVFQKGILSRLEAAFENWDKERSGKEIVVNLPLANQNYFIIYDANGGSLGRLEGAKLREDIVIAYFQAKLLIDAINHNNIQYQEWTRLQMGAGQELAEARQIAHQLIAWADTVVRRQKERVREILPGLIADIEKYRN